MDTAQKMKLKSDAMALKGLLAAVSGQIAPLNMTTYPVAGDVVTIPSLPMAGQAIKTQNDALTRIAEMLEKLVDAV
jgi:hypothetical protein